MHKLVVFFAAAVVASGGMLLAPGSVEAVPVQSSSSMDSQGSVLTPMASMTPDLASLAGTIDAIARDIKLGADPSEALDQATRQKAQAYGAVWLPGDELLRNENGDIICRGAVSGVTGQWYNSCAPMDAWIGLPDSASGIIEYTHHLDLLGYYADDMAGSDPYDVSGELAYYAGMTMPELVHNGKGGGASGVNWYGLIEASRGQEAYHDQSVSHMYPATGTLDWSATHYAYTYSSTFQSGAGTGQWEFLPLDLGCGCYTGIEQTSTDFRLIFGSDNVASVYVVMTADGDHVLLGASDTV